ncbi:inositol oxygenase [Achlya hypogyna]|uniref:Inositol oxygenase n=1 Tax=Achlya hypogyna TaxID=1202772 RepID=A0A1V9Z9I4_ACHHY|nr:inositol oxygenase [Achlya hypogyna]
MPSMTITPANRSSVVVEKVDTRETALPGKAVEEFRNYKDSDRQATVERHYRLMRMNQTVAFHEKMQAYWGTFNRAQLTVWDAFEALKGYVDSSDPDSSLPNLEHMLQTAEAIRAAGHPDWFQLVGLLHDMGKIQYLWGQPCDGQQGTADGDQWALGGDTWVVGCAIPDSAVFPYFNTLNPDMANPDLNTPNGIYSPGCGLANLKFAWGHDEYMYQMLVHNNVAIPAEGLAMIRYHSCYPWHNKGEYTQFMVDDDWDLLDWVLEFNKFDLYTKADKRPDVAALWPYYQSLIDKYMPGKLWW